MGLHSPYVPRCEMPLGSWTGFLAVIRPRQCKLTLNFDPLLRSSRSYGDTSVLRQNEKPIRRYGERRDSVEIGSSYSSRTQAKAFQQSYRPRSIQLKSSFVNEKVTSESALTTPGQVDQEYSSSQLVQYVHRVDPSQASSNPEQAQLRERAYQVESLKEGNGDELMLAAKRFPTTGHLTDSSRKQGSSHIQSSDSRQRYGPAKLHSELRIFRVSQPWPLDRVVIKEKDEWEPQREVTKLSGRREEYSGRYSAAVQEAPPRLLQLQALPVATASKAQVGNPWGPSKWREETRMLRQAPAYSRSEFRQSESRRVSVELEPVAADLEKLLEDEVSVDHTVEEPSVEDVARTSFSSEATEKGDDLPKCADIDLSSVPPEKSGELINASTSCEVLIVDNVITAKVIVDKLRKDYRKLVHACDTEVADIDVKKESPVGHGRVICFSIYCGPTADFGDGKRRLWVDVLHKPDVLGEFKAYFEDSEIKKVWHNYSFDKHVLGNHGVEARGFYADTMHLARLLNSARTIAQGGYSLEGLTSDHSLMDGFWSGADENEIVDGKRSMKHLFGKPNVKKNGDEGKLRVLPPVEELQTNVEWRDKWIRYSAFDTVCTWCLWSSLHQKLKEKEWLIDERMPKEGKTMWDFYVKYWQPFGELLVQMEANGMLLDREHLSKIEEVAVKQQEFSSNQFKKWAAKRCPDAVYMNVGSDAQVRQLLFGGLPNKNKKDPSKCLESERVFNAPNTDGYIEEGRKTPKKTRPFTLRGLGVDIPVESFTSGGWPAVGGSSLKALAGKVAIDYTLLDEEEDMGESIFLDSSSDASAALTSTGVLGGAEEDLSVYGKAYAAFGGGQEGKDACMAFAALCEVASINTLISNFIQPLQGNDIKGPDGRVHCSLNINTETGRLSARRPSLQNQPALEKDRYKIRQAFIAAPGKSLIVADYGQLELRILAHLTDCKSMLQAFEEGGDFHSRTALNMYPHVRQAVECGDVILEWEPNERETKPPAPLLKDMFGSERRKAKMLNFSIAYGKTAIGLSKDWKVSLEEAKSTVDLWYSDRPEVRRWQDKRIQEAIETHHVHTLLGRTRHFPDVTSSSWLVRGHVERAAINTPVQGSAADVAMCAMLEIQKKKELRQLGWRLLLQVHDEVILEGPSETAELAKALVVQCMSYPFDGRNTLRVALAVDAKYAQSWYAAK